MHVNSFFMKVNPSTHIVLVSVYIITRHQCLLLASLILCFTFLRGLLGSRTADADIEFEFIQGRHNIRQYRGRQRGHWNANRLLGPRQQGKEIGQDDNASKPLQFVKKATLCHRTGNRFQYKCCYCTKKKNIQKQEERRNKIVAHCTTLMSRLRDAWKVSAFQFIAVCFPRDPLMHAGSRWSMIVSNVEVECEKDTVCMSCTYFLHSSFPSWVSFQCTVCVFCSSGWQAPSGGGTQNWEASPDPQP